MLMFELRNNFSLFIFFYFFRNNIVLRPRAHGTFCTVLAENLYGRFHVVNLVFDKLITLKWVFKKRGGRLCTSGNFVNVVMKFKIL